jgi:hypothetical protein
MLPAAVFFDLWQLRFYQTIRINCESQSYYWCAVASRWRGLPAMLCGWRRGRGW